MFLSQPRQQTKSIFTSLEITFLKIKQSSKQKKTKYVTWNWG